MLLKFYWSGANLQHCQWHLANVHLIFSYAHPETKKCVKSDDFMWYKRACERCVRISLTKIDNLIKLRWQPPVSWFRHTRRPFLHERVVAQMRNQWSKHTCVKRIGVKRNHQHFIYHYCPHPYKRKHRKHFA